MSESPLLTRNVFLDTGAYEHQRFRFDHAALKKLKDLGRVGFLRILATDTVDGEVRQHICKNIDNAAVSFGRFLSHVGILESVPEENFQMLFRSLDSAKMRESALAVWDSFLKEARVEKVSAAGVQGPELLRLYFSQQAPFSAKKQSEFPDAISLLSLAYWCQVNSAQVYLIGDDPDLRAWCSEHSEMHYIKDLSGLLDLYNRAEEELSALALAIFAREEQWIVSVIEDTFLECTFTYAENWDADVENVQVTGTQVDNIGLPHVRSLAPGELLQIHARRVPARCTGGL
jgi:hypothetical protein